MSGPLVYIMGPSGSGKDTLLRLLPHYLQARIAQRTITRPASDEPSRHMPLAEFEAHAASGGFALQWRSHGLAYGIDREIDGWLAQGQIVIINGSREYLALALERYPELLAISIAVDPAVLATRLRQRGRETEAEIQGRLARAQTPFLLPANCRHAIVTNNGEPDAAARTLAAVISGSFAASSNAA